MSWIKWVPLLDGQKIPENIKILKVDFRTGGGLAAIVMCATGDDLAWAEAQRGKNE